MSQSYLISVLFLALLTLLSLSAQYPGQMTLIEGIRKKLSNDRRALELFASAGLVTVVLLLSFPMAPGPLLLGDLVPALWTAYATSALCLQYLGKLSHSMRWFRRVGFSGLLVTAIHFLFPGLVLL